MTEPWMRDPTKAEDDAPAGGHDPAAPTPAHVPDAAAPLVLEDFLARAARGLRPNPPDLFTPEAYPAVNGDHALNAELARELPERKPRPAAVLVPVVARPEPSILLTLRSAHLSNHAGQIAFPGGRVDPTDADELDAALREAREEVGLESRLVRPLGYLDGYLSRTDFWIVPVVGLVDPGYRLALNQAEVDEAFEVPLTFLMSPQNHQRHSREWKGTLRHFYAMPYEGRFIWGATAGMLRNLYERVYA